MYNSHEYWNKRLSPNKYNHTENYEEDAIKDFVSGRILDFGCGIGRTYKLYNGEVVGVDFSTVYKDRAIQAAKHLDYTHLIHNVHEEDLPFKDNYFDCGIAIKVLLHANDKEAERIIRELGRVCKRVMIIAYSGEDELVEHCFNRDYKEFISELGFNIVSHTHKAKQDIVIYEA